MSCRSSLIRISGRKGVLRSAVAPSLQVVCVGSDSHVNELSQVIQFHIYYRGNPDHVNTVTTSRIHCIHGPLDVEHTVDSHLAQRQGNMVIAGTSPDNFPPRAEQRTDVMLLVCASSHVTHRVRQVVQTQASYHLRFVELDPEPHVDEMPSWTTCTAPPSVHHQKWVVSRIKEGESQLEQPV